jgi:hypothetical protein
MIQIEQSKYHIKNESSTHKLHEWSVCAEKCEFISLANNVESMNSEQINSQ